jgi:DNA helicase-2/ATP-dependent DNA helicase PcrA
MRVRVEALLGVDCRQMWVSTFHALCARLLRREAPQIGLSRDFVIYDSTDQLSVVKHALKSLGIDDGVTQPRAALSRISHAKNRMEGPAVFSDATWNPREQQIAKIYEIYTRALKDANALDFDDLLLKTVELFETVGTGARAVQQEVPLPDGRRVSGYESAAVSADPASSRPMHRNLCVVGDPDQSIYKWRGADLRNILDFEHDFPEATIVKLERNYRSTQVILDAATAVISQNRNRKEKRLYTDLAAARDSRYYRGGDDLDEAEFIASTARTALTTITMRFGRHPVSDQRAIANGRRRAPPESAWPTRSSAASGSTSAKKSKTRSRISNSF